MVLRVVLVLESKSLVHPHPQSSTILLLFLVHFEEEKLPTFEENAPTPTLHFGFMLHVTNFLQYAFLNYNLEMRLECI
jgi:hypothetical protein